jgi:multidrug resistance efflux pump
MTSRYDVTKAKLDRATDSNVSLLKDCKRLERAETENAQEIDRLRKQLRKATHDLDKAKIIARNALVKVEELTMASLQQMSRAQNHGSYSAGGSARTLSSMIQSGSVDQDEEIGPLLESIDTLEQQINGARQYNHESRGKSKREGMLHNHLEKHNQRSSPRSRQVTTSKR